MSFVNGFNKLAGEPVAFGAIGKKLLGGLKAGGGETIKDTLKLKGLKHISDAAKASGGWKKSLTTQAGRETLAEGVGKAAPSVGMAAGYGMAAKKAYNKLSRGDDQGQGGYY